VSDDGAGKIGTVAAERSDAAVGSGADEAGDDWDDAGFEKREKNFAATLRGLVEMRLRVTERVTGKDEIGRGDRNGGDAGFFERGSKEPGAEAFTERSEAIEELGTGSDAAVDGDFMKKVAGKELQFAADAKVIAVPKLEIVKNVEVKIKNELGFAARVGKFAICESASDGEKVVGDTFHGGDNHSDAGFLRGGANETCGMEHAFGT
jgi:hypothetical protein